MASGIQVLAPFGYKAMKKEVGYHLLRSDPIRRRVVLVAFHDKSATGPRRYEIAILSREDYENGLVPPMQDKPAPIKPVEKPMRLPPWLASLEKYNNLDSLPALNTPTKNREISHADDIDRRTGIIHSAVLQVGAILSSDDPDRELNRLARACRPKAQNETRFRLWFFCYVAFGYNRWALLPPMSEWGKWKRTDPERQDTKFGRPDGHLGSQFGSGRKPEMLEKCIEGFQKFAKKCDNMAEVWASTMLKIFKCRMQKSADRKRIFVHPGGEPFPSFEQFRYHVYKTIGKSEVRKVLYGEQRTRSEDDAVVGSYAESLSNIGECAYFDARSNAEHPKSYLSNTPLPKLYVVELVDGLTGRIEGVGFSLGGETAQAYKGALFCAAILKSKLGEIIGFPISDDDWPGHGLPISLACDRGAGASDAVKAAVAPWHIAHVLQPSYTPQSDSPVESKHRRSKRRAGAPEYVASKHTVIEMIKRETARVIKQNNGDSALARASDVAIVKGGVKTPGDYWRYMNARHRSDLICDISFEDAVRAFLEPVRFTVNKGRLFFRQREYRSPELVKCGFAQRMRHMQGMEVDGFIFPMAMKIMWVVVNGNLIEVYATARHQDDDAEMWVCRDEFEATARARSKASGAQQAQRPLEIAGGLQDFKDATGKDWHSGTKHIGRAKAKTKAARIEVAMIKG